jgi:hypothetical protein
VSALLFALLRDRISIRVDTRAIGCAGVAKAWPLVHLPAVLCGRGAAGLFVDLAARAAAVAESMDELLQQMPTVLDGALRAGAPNIARLSERNLPRPRGGMA